MSQQLEINGKEYFPSTLLAAEYSYTPDYIAKLARDERVLGTRVGRQWFIEPESLRTYVQQLEVEKRLQKEDLSQQRKFERQQVSGEQEVKARVNAPVATKVLAPALSVVVMSCGLLVGYLGFFAYSAGVSVTDLDEAGHEVWQTISAKLALGTKEIIFLVDRSASAAANPTLGLGVSSLESAPILVDAGPRFEVGTYALFPSDQVTHNAPLVNSVEPELEQFAIEMGLPFSDEVAIRVEDGELYVRPVFDDTLHNAQPVIDLLPANSVTN